MELDSYGGLEVAANIELLSEGADPESDDELLPLANDIADRLAQLGLDPEEDEAPWILPESEDEGPDEELQADRSDSPIGPDIDHNDDMEQSSTPPPSSPGSPSQPLVYPSRRPPFRVYMESHSQWFVRITLILIVYLHFSYHLPFAACDLALFTFFLIIKGLKLSENDPVPRSLATAMKRLDIRDRFQVLPICATCHHIVLDPPVPGEALKYSCSGCNEPIYSPSGHPIIDDVLEFFGKKRLSPPPKPRLVVSYRPISDLISEFLLRDGMVEKMDEWRYKPGRSDDIQGDIMDGRVWKELEGGDGKPFFGDHCPEELRIGITVNLDW